MSCAALNIGMVTVDCEDPKLLAEFWSRALQMEVLGDFGNFVFLGRKDESPNLGLHRVPEPKSGKNRVHIDLDGEHRAAAAERLEALGATVQGEHSEAGLSWIVLADPEGNEFCIGEHTD